MFFSGGTLSSQRSESTTNAICCKMKATSSLCDFHGIFSDVVHCWRVAVRGEDLRCSQGNIDSYLPSDPFLESIRRVYTVKAFREVQQLHKDGMLCRQE